jgi:hypothetical protein
LPITYNAVVNGTNLTALKNHIGVAEVVAQKNELEKIEQSINKCVRQIVFSKLVICVSLAQIYDDALYRKDNFRTFKQYLASGRINLPTSTASEYAKIGRVYLQYREELDRIDFREEDGLKKLLILEKAISQFPKEAVFSELKQMSYRTFKREFARANGSPSESMGNDVILRFNEDEHALYMEIDGVTAVKIVEFTDDLDNYCGREIFSRLRKEIVSVVTSFFS